MDAARKCLKIKWRQWLALLSVLRSLIRRKNQRMNNAIGGALILVAGMVAVGAMVIIGMDRQEAVECDGWQQQAQQYPSFYLLKWQKEQCDANGIVINAKVE
jgi:hypothetical protein